MTVKVYVITLTNVMGWGVTQKLMSRQKHTIRAYIFKKFHFKMSLTKSYYKKVNFDEGKTSEVLTTFTLTVGKSGNKMRFR